MKYLVGNWKMNLGVSESLGLLSDLNQAMGDFSQLEVILCPSTLALVPVFAKNKGHFSLAAQNCFYKNDGAFTGEVSAAQLQDFVQYCLMGHSERRQLFHENDTDVNLKLKACLKNNIRPILCIGESLNQKQDGETESVLRNQIDGALMGVMPSEAGRILIAYEPVWAIGGEPPELNEINQSIDIIKTQIMFMYNDLTIPILYGGGVNEDNAEGIASLPYIDGFLAGNSSLNAEKFAIIGEILKRGSGLTW